MNGFEKHGIKHMSPSSINMWCNSQGAWVAKYIHKEKFPFSPAAKAGVLAEEATVKVLLGSSRDDAVNEALKDFNRSTVFQKDDKTMARGDAIPAMVDGFLSELKQYGEPEFNSDGSQKGISITCKGDDWSIPVIGYLDLYFPQHNLVVDLKTTFRMPSSLSTEHARQCAIYKTAMGCDTKFLYASPKKTAWLECDDVSAVMADIKTILIRQEKILRLCDKGTLTQIVDIQPDSYYWSDGADGIRKKLFSL